MRFLLLGATGLVGRNALAQALAQPAVTEVIAPTRKPLTKQDKLINPVASKLELLLPEVTGWGPDAAICATGTTIKKAGSKEAFRSVDHDLPLSFARLACHLGASDYSFIPILPPGTTSREPAPCCIHTSCCPRHMPASRFGLNPLSR
jgi:uncharacterized protein YbjT (DUF2867 family)